MSKNIAKRAGRFERAVLPAAIILLTVAYLVLTAGGVGSPIASQNTTITYDTAPITYGDVQFMSESNFGESNYGKKNNFTTVSFYTSGKEEQSGTSNFQMYDRYEKITFNDHAAPSNTIKMEDDHTYDRFYKNYTQTTVATGVGSATLPVLSTTGTGIYTVVPGSTGDYYIYVYSEGNPNGAVQYTLIENAAAANAYKGTSSTALTFSNAAGNWWRAKVTVKNVGWYAVSPICKKNSITDDRNGSKSDTGRGEKKGDVLTNSLLTKTTYYFNEWSVTNAAYDTLLVLQWDKSVQIGLVGKEGSVTVENGANGTVSVQTAFGEAVSGKAIHAPLYITGTPAESYVFAGLTADGTSVETTLLTDNIVSYPFMSDVTLTAAWEKAVTLPDITVSLNEAPLAELNFLTAKAGSTTFVGGTDAVYTFVVNFGESSATSVSYTVSGETTASGTLSAATEDDPDANACTVSAMWANSAVTFTVTQGESTYTITYTIKCINTGSAVAMIEETGDTFTYLEDALVAANSTTESRKVVVLRDVSFYAGTPNASWTNDNAGYTIGSNVTLLIPYAPNATTVDGSTTGTDGISGSLAYANKTFVATNANALDTEFGKYLTVTVPDGIELTIESEGKFVIGGTIGSTTGISGATVGEHSNVILDGTLNIEGGGILSCCGYILGKGTINAASGAKIYQPFVVMDYGSGSYTVATDGAIAPFSRFTVQNIQTTMDLVSGAMLYGYCDLYTGAKVMAGLFDVPAQHNLSLCILVGGIKSGALVEMAEGGRLHITYAAEKYASSYNKVGKTTMEFSGGASLGTLTLNVRAGTYEQPVSTAEVDFPLPYNYDIKLMGENSTYTMGYSFSILPGASVTVGEGATLNIGNSASDFRFMVFDGLYDHTSTGAEVTYGQNLSYRYPVTEVIQSAPFNGTGAGSLVVDGTLNILEGANFGGVVETGGTTGKIVMDGNANPVCTVGLGLVSGSYGGRTERTLTAEVVDAGTGLRTAMVAGKTYQAKEGSAVLPTYTYKLWTKNSTSESHTETLNALVNGGWYNYSATVKMMNGAGEEVSSYPIWFCHNANVAGMGFYSDTACITEAKTITADNTVLYSKAEAAEAMLNGEHYYPTLLQAVKNATGTDDVVTLLNPITLSQSIPVDKAQEITVDLDGNDISYTATPFINDGDLTLLLNGAAITNKVGDVYTVAPAFTNNATATVDLGGGSITVQAPAKNTAQVEGIVNYGTLTVKDSAETPGSINVYSDLGAAGKEYALETSYHAAAATAYPTVTVNAELAALNLAAMPIYVGIYNTGTLASLSDVTVHSPFIGVYNGAAAHIKYPINSIDAKAVPKKGEIKSTVESISGATVEGGWVGLLNVFGTVESIADQSLICSTGRMLPTDAAASYVALYNYLGSVNTISNSEVLSEEALTLTRYRYGMEGVNAALGAATLNSSSKRVTTTNTVYGIFNFGWITADATKAAGYDLRTSTVKSIENCTIVGEGTHFKDGVFTGNQESVSSTYCGEAPNNANGYGIYNNGGTIGGITGGTVQGNRGIYNVNMVYTTTLYGDNQSSGDFTWKKDTRIVPKEAIGTFGDLTDCTVHGTYDYGLLNYGLVGIIGGEAEIKVTPAVTRGYALNNAGAWYGTTVGEATITERESYTDSAGATKYRETKKTTLFQNFTAPAETFKEAEDYWKSIDVPTIEAIKGNAVIRAVNHSGSNEYARALTNTGRIDEIGGNAEIRAEKIENGKYSSYALYNYGGYIGKITGNTELVAQYNYGLANTSNRYGKEIVITTYNAEGTKASTDTYREYVPAYIGSISGATIKTEAHTTALSNSSWIKTIEGGEITAGTNSALVQNATSVLKKSHAWTKHVLETTGNPDGQFYHEENTYYESRIGTIDGTTITAATYGIQNYGDIGTITEATVYGTKQNLYNGESNIKVYTVNRYNMGQVDQVNNARFITLEEREYTYQEKGSHIGTVSDCTFAAPTGKTTNTVIYNLGTIDTIENTEVTAANTGLTNVASGYYTERNSFRYLYGDKVFGTSQYLGEQNVNYARNRAYIGLIDDVTVTVDTTNAFVNYGEVDTIQDSSFTAGTYQALYNGASGTYYLEYVDDYYDDIVLNDAGTGYAYKRNTNEGYKKDHVGEIGKIIGTTFTANAVAKNTAAVENLGAIGTINGADITVTAASGVTEDRGLRNKGTIGTVTDTVINTSNSYALENVGSYNISSILTYQAGTKMTANPVVTTENAKITELGEGNEFTAGKQYAVRNETNNTISKISGGIYTSTGQYALYNNSTTNAILLTGGDYKGGSAGNRADAVFNPDDVGPSPDKANRYTYEDGMSLTPQDVTEEVTFADDSVVAGYYFIGAYTENEAGEIEGAVAVIVKRDKDGNEQTQGWYTSLQDAVDAYRSSNYYIQLLTDIAADTTTNVDKDIYLDLNTHKVDGAITVAEEKTLYGMDKSTDGYGEAKGSLTATGNVAAAAVHPGYAGQMYAAHKDSNGVYTFNRASFFVSDYYVEAWADDYDEERRKTEEPCYGAVGFAGVFLGNADAAAALQDVGFEIRSGEKGSGEIWAEWDSEEGKPDEFVHEYKEYKVYYTMDVSDYGEYGAFGLMQFGSGTDAVIGKGGKEEKSFDFVEVLRAYYATLEPDSREKEILEKFAEKAEITLTQS